MSNPAPIALNLRAYPSVTPQEGVVVIGDLHDNPIKLIYLLMKTGKIQGLSEADYTNLCKIYYDSAPLALACYEQYDLDNWLKTEIPSRENRLNELLAAKDKNEHYAGRPVTEEREQMARQHLAEVMAQKDRVDNDTSAFIKYLNDYLPEFIRTLKKCEELPALTFTFRLIGDEQFDRGNCGIFTRAVLRVLTEKNMDWDVNLSNHGVVGLYKDRAYAYSLDKRRKQAMSGITMFAVEDHGQSLLVGLDLKNFMEKIYLPRLKLGGYLLRNNGTMDVDYHAPVDDSDILNQAEFLGISYEFPLSHRSRATLIDAISDRVRDYAIAGRMNEIVVDCDFDSFDGKTMVDMMRKHNPINFAIWNRKVDYLNRPDEDGVSWRHGHEQVAYTEPHLQCVDSQFGKGDIVVQDPREKTQVYVVTQGRPALQARAAVSIPPKIPAHKRLLMELSADFVSGLINAKFLSEMIDAVKSTPNLITLRKRFIELKNFAGADPGVIERSLKRVDDDLAACTAEQRLLLLLQARVQREFGHYKAGNIGSLKYKTLTFILDHLQKKPDLQLSDFQSVKVHGMTFYDALNIQRGFFKTAKANSLKRVERETNTTTMRLDAVTFLNALDRRLRFAPKSEAKRKAIKKLIDALLSTTNVINSLDDLCNLRAEPNGKTLLQVLNMHRYKEPAEKTTKSYDEFCRLYDLEEMLGVERLTAIKAS